MSERPIDFAEVVIGFMLGMMIATVAGIGIRDQGREECESKLPRTEKCVQQWVPQPAAGDKQP